MDKHTQLPWSITADGLIQGGQYNTPIARIGSSSLMAGSVGERDANGAYIVLCVNSHRDLVEALEAAEKDLQSAPHSWGFEFTSLPKIRAALAKANGETT